MINIAEQTLASIVTEHHETVSVLEKYHLDFCCKGKRTLLQACTEKGLPLETVMEELETSFQTKEVVQVPYAEMNAEQLIRYILVHHHFYIRQSMPAIEERLTKVATKHGSNYPYMKKVLELFSALKSDLYLHMQKEEVILFPRIKELEVFSKYAQKRTSDSSFIEGPVSVMESEHNEAGAIMEQISTLTNNYTAPRGACTTHCVVLEELKAFEEDLHRHVHLENNLLFPLAKKLLAA